MTQKLANEETRWTFRAKTEALLNDVIEDIKNYDASRASDYRVGYLRALKWIKVELEEILE